MDIILSLTPPIAAVSLFFYMRYQSRLAKEDNRRMFSNYKSEEQSHSLWQEKFVDFVHLSCSQTNWLPVFIKVYFLGVFECIINTIHKYIFVNDQGSRNDQIKNLIESARDKQSPTKRLAVITGGDTGIGCELAKALMESGMDVIITGRSERPLQHAVQRIKAAVAANEDQISGLKLELSNFEEVREFVKKLKKLLDGRQINVFVNNAGVMNPPFKRTEDDLELQSQVNAFSTLLLTLSILPLLSKRDSRVVTTSSSVLYALNHINISKFRASYGWDGLAAYAQSKLTLALLTKHLAELVHEVNPTISINSCHPGTVRTSLFQYTTIFTLSIFRHLFNYIMLSPREGILTALHLCLHESAGSVTGELWLNRLPRPIGLVTIGLNDEAEEVEEKTVSRWLWNTSLDICGLSEVEAKKLIDSL
ncbi:hypothetical protein K450DRAFT_278430, partial [Umbelopsis ramanniana AG]